MTRRKKRVFAILGLALVGALTAFAWSLPSSDASAVDGEDEETGGTRIVVTVRDSGTLEGPLVNIIKIGGEAVKDDMIVFNPSKVLVSVTRASEISGVLSCDVKADTPEKIEINADEVEDLKYSTSEEQVELNFDTTALDGLVASCVVNVTARDGTPSSSDDVDFYYQTLKVSVAGTDREPMARIAFRGDVAKLSIMVYDKSGNPVFVNADGEPEPIEVDGDQLNHETGIYERELAPLLDKYDAKAGTYNLTVTAYNADGEAFPVAYVEKNEFKYALDTPSTPGTPGTPGATDPETPGNPDTPDVPPTGSIARDLNISRVDYILIGLIAFGSIAGFAIYLMVKKSRR